jgi:hypothetical protein
MVLRVMNSTVGSFLLVDELSVAEPVLTPLRFTLS